MNELNYRIAIDAITLTSGPHIHTKSTIPETIMQINLNEIPRLEMSKHYLNLKIHYF